MVDVLLIVIQGRISLDNVDDFSEVFNNLSNAVCVKYCTMFGFRRDNNERRRVHVIANKQTNKKLALIF